MCILLEWHKLQLYWFKCSKHLFSFPMIHYKFRFQKFEIRCKVLRVICAVISVAPDPCGPERESSVYRTFVRGFVFTAPIHTYPNTISMLLSPYIWKLRSSTEMCISIYSRMQCFYVVNEIKTWTMEEPICLEGVRFL